MRGTLRRRLAKTPSKWGLSKLAGTLFGMLTTIGTGIGTVAEILGTELAFAGAVSAPTPGTSLPVRP